MADRRQSYTANGVERSGRNLCVCDSHLIYYTTQGQLEVTEWPIINLQRERKTNRNCFQMNRDANVYCCPTFFFLAFCLPPTSPDHSCYRMKGELCRAAETFMLPSEVWVPHAAHLCSPIRTRNLCIIHIQVDGGNIFTKIGSFYLDFLLL